MPEASKRILIVDDHPIVRSAFAGMVDSQPDMEVCGEASEASVALRMFRETSPDLAVVDLVLGDGSGLELIKQVRTFNTRVRILVASMYDEQLFAKRMLRAGANGYVHKDEPTGVILHAIRHVLAGGTALSDPVASGILDGLMSTRPAEPPAGLTALSDRELEVFTLIGQGLTTKGIADHLSLSVKTIETYRGHIKAKLGLKSINELAAQAAKWGLKGAQISVSKDSW